MASSARGHYAPTTRLGGGAFNHLQSSSAEQEYDRLRDQARQEHARMASCFDRAHNAYESGNGAEAHALSEEGKKHKTAAERYNQQASEFVFRENNAVDRVPSDTIDLHGQFVEEAEDILEARIRQAKREHQTHLHVIVGKGNHSPGHVQKIKPRVEQVCQEEGLSYHTEANAGRIYVDLTGGNIDYDLPPPGQTPPKFQGGYSGSGYGGVSYAQHAGDGGYPGQQQPQYQQQQYQQRPQQQFDQEQPQEKQNPITSCLKVCCIVM